MLDDKSAMLMIAKVAEVSFPATLYKTLRLRAPGHVVAIVRDGIILESDATPGSWPPPTVGLPIEAADMSGAFDPDVVTGNTELSLWRLRVRVADHEFNPSPAAMLHGKLASLPNEQRMPTHARQY